jgi:pimeloyl-ACP methyl ester carboxylesterase
MEGGTLCPPLETFENVVGGMGWLREASALQKVWERLPPREGSRTPAACVHSIAKLAVTEAEVRGVHAPVTMIVGSRDPTKRMYVEPLTRIRKDWPVVEIEGAGHMNCIFKDRFKEAIERWLSRQAAAR